ncbi:MAG: hypothetical protein ACLRSD_16275 [Oscillibacter sp.]
MSFNKVFAKLGSDYKKPDATTVIARDNWRDIVFPLPVGDLLFVGRSAQELLAATACARSANSQNAARKCSKP